MYLLKCRCNDLSTVINNTHHFCSFRRNQQRVRGHKFCGWQSQISQPSPGDVDATRWSRAGQILRVLQPDSQLKEFALCSARIPSESEQPKQFPAVIPSIYLYLFILCSISEEKKIDLKKTSCSLSSVGTYTTYELARDWYCNDFFTIPHER